MPDTTSRSETVDDLSFEEAIQRLEALVEELERSEISLDEAVQAYEEGMMLAQHCQGHLDDAELRIEELTPGEST